MKVPSLTPDQIRSALSYDADTGGLRWVANRSNNARAGSIAGSIAGNGRRYIVIGVERLPAHRVAWAHATGAWPSGNISPKDGDYLNLRFSNLVEETTVQTARKRRILDANKSGVPGVWFDKARGRWTAFITRDYKRITLGRFLSKDDAIAARQSALGTAESDLSPDERATIAVAVKTRARQRGLWERTLKQNGGVTGWASLDEFIRDVGFAPKRNHVLSPVDKDLVIGPDNFYWAPPVIGDFDIKTKEGLVAYRRAHRAANPMLYRHKELKKNFDIDLAEYQRKFAAQGGVCAICAQPETAKRGDKVKWLAVDHCHESGAIRDLLCEHCNKLIGFAREDVRVLEGAIAYLRKHKQADDEASDNVVALHPQAGRGTT